MTTQLQQDWNGKTGSEIRQIMLNILQRAESAADTIEDLTSGSNTFLPSTILGYYDEGSDTFYSDANKMEKITGEKNKIYYNLENLPDAYYYNENTTAYYKISNPADIQTRLDIFDMNKAKEYNTMENVISRKISTSDFNLYKDEQEKINNQLRIVDNLSEAALKPVEEQLFFLTTDTTAYPKGMYFYDKKDGRFKRVGGLL